MTDYPPSQFPLAEGEAYYSTIIPVPADALWKLVHRFTSISEWAPQFIECCLVENDVDPIRVGCRRRTAVKRGLMAGSVICETLLALHQSTHKKFLSYCLTDSEAELMKRLKKAEEDQLYKGHSSLALSMDDRPHPFPCRVHELITTISVSPLSTDLFKSIVEVHCSFSVPTEDLVPVDVLDYPTSQITEIVRRLGVKEVKNLENFLLEQWITPLVISMSDSALAIQYPITTGFNMQYRAEYDQYDEFVVQLSADPKVDPRVADKVQNMLDSWTTLTREVFSLRGLVHTLTEELAAARCMANAANTLVTGVAVVEAEFDHETSKHSVTPSPAKPTRDTSSGATPAKPTPAERQEPEAAAHSKTSPAGESTQTQTPMKPMETQTNPASPTRDRHAETSGPYRESMKQFDPAILTRALSLMTIGQEAGRTVDPINQHNIGSEAYLRHLFQLLDVENKGYFTEEEFALLWERGKVGELQLDRPMESPRKKPTGVANANAADARTQDPKMLIWLKKNGVVSKHPSLTYGKYVVPFESFSLFVLQAAKI
jgi:hypothetical protein